LIEQLIGRSDVLATDSVESLVLDVANALVTKGVEIHGDHITDEQLFAWLRIGRDAYGETSRDPDCQKRLSTWLNFRHDRYKGLLAMCFALYGVDEKHYLLIDARQNLLLGVAPTTDIGLWHFQRMINEPNELLAKEHLSAAMKTLFDNQGNAGLTIEMILEWAEKDPIRQIWLEPYLYREIPDWQKAHVLNKKKNEAEQSKNRQERGLCLLKSLPEIKSATVAIGVLSQLANVWNGRYSDFHGDTPRDRYEKAYEHSERIYNAAQDGFRACVFRDDIPLAQDILALYIKDQEYKIGLPLLIGAQLRWEESPTFIDQISDETLTSLFCFYVLTAPRISASWGSAMLSQKTNLVADVLVKYASLCFEKKRETGDVFSQLLHESTYYDVAHIAIPQLLQKFPLKSTTAQLGALKALLQAGLRYVEAEMPHLIAQRIARKSLDMPQRVYWLTAGLIVAPDVYEKQLWDYVESSWKKVQLISDLLWCGMGTSSRVADRLPPYTLGRLIEISAPHASFVWGYTGEVVTFSDAMHLADQIHALVSILSERVSEESLTQLRQKTGILRLRGENCITT